MKKIAVLGTGYVGLVSGTCFAEIGNRVVCCDIDQMKIDNLNKGIIPIYEPGLKEMVDQNRGAGRLSFTTDISNAVSESEIIYIAVGTPMSENGAADLRFVKDAAKIIGENLNGYKIIAIKSTVPVGTGRLVQSVVQNHLKYKDVQFDVVSNPEFLREGTALKDCMNMERSIIGATSEEAAQSIADLHKPFHTKILFTSLESAEMIKYASNTFLATKISFINAIANICEKVGADVNEVAKGMGMDERIGSKFLRAGIGYGGSCFPKDTHALVHIAESVGYDFDLLKAVIQTNEHQQLIVVEKAKQILGSLYGMTVAVLGLAFKPNTNDMREAPSLKIIPTLLKEGASVKAYDPIALNEALNHFENRIEYFSDLYEAIQKADVTLVLTEWEEIQNMDLNRFKNLVNQRIIIDGRNCLSVDKVRSEGIIYHSIGRPVVTI